MTPEALRMADDPSPSGQEVSAMREALHRQMLSTVSHDLKTPLVTMIGSLEIYTRMESKLSEEKKKTLLASALTEAYRLDNFITNILDMAKLEGGDVKAKSEKCTLTYLLNDCLGRMGPKRDRCKITLEQERQSNITVNTDPALLGRAVSLILENAVKHGGPNPVITVEYDSDGRKGYIRIHDNGPGIPAGKEKEIFSKYTRFVHTDHQNAGTGLGLAICAQLMKILSGTVEASNHPNGGAVFLLTFPSGRES